MRLVGILFIAFLVFTACSSKKDLAGTAPMPEVMQPKEATHVLPGTAVSFDMVYIPAGSFMMGSREEADVQSDDEMPQHEVQVEAFWMGKYEVAFEEYLVLREKELDQPTEDQPAWDADAIARPSPPYEDPTFGMGQEGYPAVSMTQFAALQYCKWLSEKSGTFYRLPSEAEWEYACKAGRDAPYYWGCLLYTSPSPRDLSTSRMPSSA